MKSILRFYFRTELQCIKVYCDYNNGTGSKATVF